MTIAEYALSDDNFSILVQALTKAELVNVLNGEGNFTVFAPTNAAFTALFSQLGISGIADLSKETLTPILLYHVLGTEAKSSMITTGYYNTLSPAQGSYLSLKADVSSGVKLNKTTNVTTADVDVKNGVIHVIDKVLLPPSVVDQALANDAFSILVQAVVKAGLVETLSGSGPVHNLCSHECSFRGSVCRPRDIRHSRSYCCTADPDTYIPCCQRQCTLNTAFSRQCVETLNGQISSYTEPVTRHQHKLNDSCN